jgi:hypothetical protein
MQPFFESSFTSAESREHSLEYNLLREYLEELFGLNIPNSDPGWLERDPNIKFLRRLIAKRRAYALVTGAVINLLTMRPEICCLFVFGDEWSREHASGKDGLAPRVYNPEWREQSVWEIPVAELTRWIDPGKTVPQGAAAVVLGLRAITAAKGQPLLAEVARAIGAAV